MQISNTTVAVGLVPDEQVVVMTVDEVSFGLPPGGAIRVGLMLTKAGLSCGAQVASEDNLEGIALMLERVDALLEAMS